MLEANEIFTLEGDDLTIQCTKEEKMKDICQKYSNKVQKNINSLIFLYGGNQLNFNISFRELVKDEQRNEIKILVYINLDCVDYFVGALWSHFSRGKETSDFEYSDEWINNKKSFSLEPGLYLGKGKQVNTRQVPLFGSFGDSAPDTWGRILMRRYENQLAKKENRSPRTLNEIDYLLFVNDIARQGALRFKTEDNEEFQYPSNIRAIPPLIDLTKLLAASEKIIESSEKESDLQLLLAPGSSLGGARPKASVIDKEGNLCIAKFPKKDDFTNNVLWEGVALTLAKQCGLNVQEWSIQKAGKKNVILLKNDVIINGTFGIGVGIQTTIPSHNLGEVVDATIALINNPNTNICLIPDLPQPCDLIDANWQEICDSGSGSVKVRGRIITNQNKNGEYVLNIISLPDQTTTTAVYDKVNDMMAKKELPMIKDIFNSVNTKNEMPDIRIILKQGSDPEYVKQILFAKTPVQSNIRINFEIVGADGIDIPRYSYKQYLLQFIDFRLNMKFRLYCNKLQQVMTKHHQYDALVKVLESGAIDTIISMVRKYKGTNDDEII